MATAPVAGLVLKRLASGLVTLFIVTLMVFAGTELLPGDIAEAILGQQATPETVAAFREMTNHHSMALLKNYDKWLADRIRESGKAAPNEKGLRAGVGIYYFEQEMDS